MKSNPLNEARAVLAAPSGRVNLFLKNLLFITIIIIHVMIAVPVLGGHSGKHNSSPANTNHLIKDTQYSNVMAVIDGDTIEIEGKKRVRYLGIDTPEAGQPFYKEAKNKNKELVLGKIVRLEICKAEPTDKHGRQLAYVYIGQTMANAELLKSGYARLLNISPCGAEKAEEFRKYQKEAMDKKIGLWGERKQIITKDFISASDAIRFINEKKAIYGMVVGVRQGRKAIFLDMGNTAKVGLRVVIFNQDKKNFEDDGINPLTYYKAKEVVVYGKLKMYKGTPEVVIGSPSHIEVWQ
ncbi:MAG: thermonuclease family protein [Deltaproteobacteria bacterium]|nr:thermonuclease family protein [Deltaproteobacteria bacterium]